MTRSELVQSVINWDGRFPLDRWWRMKHNVAFMSPEHRESSFLFQLFEFEEDKIFFNNVDSEEKKYIPGSGDFIKSEVSTESFQALAQKEIQKILNSEDNARR